MPEIFIEPCFVCYNWIAPKPVSGVWFRQAIFFTWDQIPEYEFHNIFDVYDDNRKLT